MELSFSKAFKTKKEYQILGKKKIYDVLTSKPFLKALFAYDPRVFKLVWMSKTFYINGIKQVSKKRNYFFRYRNNYNHLRRNISNCL